MICADPLEGRIVHPQAAAGRTFAERVPPHFDEQEFHVAARALLSGGLHRFGGGGFAPAPGAMFHPDKYRSKARGADQCRKRRTAVGTADTLRRCGAPAVRTIIDTLLYLRVRHTVKRSEERRDGFRKEAADRGTGGRMAEISRWRFRKATAMALNRTIFSLKCSVLSLGVGKQNRRISANPVPQIRVEVQEKWGTQRSWRRRDSSRQKRRRFQKPRSLHFETDTPIRMRIATTKSPTRTAAAIFQGL